MPVVGDLMAGMTQYTFWLIVSSIVLLVLMFAFVSRLSLVPHGRFANAMEYVVQYIENDIGRGILGEQSWRKHFPFLATLFMFILVNNIIGVIPGMKPGTGTISTTAALALVAFIYFIGVGVQAHGAWGYAKSLAPKGVGFPLNILIWVWQFTRPGMMTPPWASTYPAPGFAALSSASSPTATMVSPSMATAPRSR